jgi:hypothetical protein
VSSGDPNGSPQYWQRKRSRSRIDRRQNFGSPEIGAYSRNIMTFGTAIEVDGDLKKASSQLSITIARSRQMADTAS